VVGPQRVAIVTGAGSSGPGVGNGKATAVVLAREGYAVVLVDRSLDAAHETAAMIRAEGGIEPAAIVGHVLDQQVAHDAVIAAGDRFGRLDVLVNNVGTFGPGGGIEAADPDTWGPAMNVNVTSIALMAKYAVPAMQAVGGGAIVNLTSVAGLAGTSSDALCYSATKGAVIALTRHLAALYGVKGIRVNCVAPGMVETPMVAGRIDDALRTKMRLASPLRTPGTAWDVAEGVAFLASQRARWISGVVLPVDGGLMAVVPSTEGPWPGEIEPTAP
jgi:NAD(P)-dependent dehydrogenase (short-subunit alcohol dehydrogenase family)